MNDFPIVSVINRLGGASAAGRDLGVAAHITWGWMKRNRVPSWRLPALQSVAKKSGLDVEALCAEEAKARAEWLQRLSKRKKRVPKAKAPRKAKKRRAA